MHEQLSLFFYWKVFWKSLKFHGSLDIPQYLIKKARVLKKNFAELEQISSLRSVCTIDLLSQYLWFNKDIRVANNSVYFSHFSNHGINFIGSLVDINGKYKL